ncbi:MAG: DNA polymerase I [Burkholderiales bacterium]|jgi:DNA polymerase-1|nr:DNA polymerase I [Burkholderiales bacterium]
MPLLVLVDGSSYLYRAYHALPDLRTSRHEPTGALRGVLSMLRRLVDEYAPDYFAVVFDAPGKTFRNDWYPDYKAHRPPMPDDLVAQIAPLHDCVRAQGWPLLIESGIEADDVIGTLVRTAQAQGWRTLISTSDKDMAQLVAPDVTCVNTMSSETLDEAGVVAKFGVTPAQMIDYLTLIGDTADNVPGVTKVGPKTAVKWLAQYHTLDGLIAHADEISGAAGNHLREALDWLPQARRLVTIKTDCALSIAPEALRIEPADVEALSALYTRFDFKSWLRNTSKTPPKRSPAILPTAPEHNHVRAIAEPAKAVSPPLFSEGKPAALSYETVLDETTLERWCARLDAAAQAGTLISFDLETTALDPLLGEIVGLSFADAAGEACYIPVAHHYAGAPAQLDRAAVLQRLTAWFENADAPKLGQNLKYDQHILANHGIALRGVRHDTMLQSYVLESHRPHDLDALAERHLNWPTIRYDELTGKGAHRIPFEQVAVDRAADYAAEDADVALHLHHALHPRLQAVPSLLSIYEDLELPVREVLFTMERHGVLIDRERLARHSHELGQRLLTLENEAHALAGQPFNLASPKQLGDILFSRMKLPPVKKTSTGQPSTDEEVLQTLAADYPLPKVLLEHRMLAKLKSTYTDKLPAMINARTGRVHTTFSQTTAVTGRLASSEPNLQNIPARTAEGRRIREAFIAPAETVLLSADYSQIELRIMAHLSEDAGLLQAFHDGADIHRATAAEIFGIAPAEVSAEQRRYIKAVNFGLIYGMSAFGLAQQLGIERAAAQQFIDRYFARYPGVARYMETTREQARARGYVETVFGRRLTLTDINGGSGPRRAAAERAAINAPMQGTAADLIKKAMIAVQQWLDRNAMGTRLLLQVHDELVLEVPENEIARVEQDLPLLMCHVAQLRVPLAVNLGKGRHWDEAH